MNRTRGCKLLASLALAGSLGLAAAAAWPQAKALAARVLLERAWQASDQGRRLAPWPSADMAPIARLTFPRLGAGWIVLDNDSGQALAFGPGWNARSAPPGQHGLVVISAHRDTQFRLLQELQAGERITLSSRGRTRAYRVTGQRVVDSRRTRLATGHGPDQLLLVTCYPFDAITAGGPLRYVVSAQPEGKRAGSRE